MSFGVKLLESCKNFRRNDVTESLLETALSMCV